MFKVVPDQLKVSDGWVRCGHCDGVFDASAHFQAITEPEVLDVPDTEVQEPDVAVPGIVVREEPTDFVAPITETSTRALVDELSLNVSHELTKEIDRQIHQASQPTEPEAPVAHSFTAKSHIDDASVSAALSSYLSAPEAADLPIHEDHGRSQDAPDRRALYGSTTSIKPFNSVKTENARRPAIPEVTFVQSAKRREKSKGPLYTVLAVLIALGLLGALALQVLLHERDTLAARYPALLPTLEAVCEKMDCQVKPPRVIDAITIDSSSFTQSGPDAYRLNFVLKNTWSAVVAMPALEVTLTGSQNEVLMRRVLLPAEFGATNDRLEQTGTFAGGLTLLVSPPPVSVQSSQAASAVGAVPAEVTPASEAPAGSVPITGYRLFAFYP